MLPLALPFFINPILFLSYLIINEWNVVSNEVSQHNHCTLYDRSDDNENYLEVNLDNVPVKSGSTPVRGPVKSGRKRTKDKGRGLDKRLVRPELVTAWIQRLRTTSVDPLRRFRSRRRDGDRDGDGQDQE